jgi:5-methylcytosine-specific restriction endonuclease McrA
MNATSQGSDPLSGSFIESTCSPKARRSLPLLLRSRLWSISDRRHGALRFFPCRATDSRNHNSMARRISERKKNLCRPSVSDNSNERLMPIEDPSPNKTDVRFASGISRQLRIEVLKHGRVACRMCGLSPLDIDPYTGEKGRLHVGHIRGVTLGGRDELANLQAVCSTCKRGAKHVTNPKPTRIWLLSQIRRADQDEQRAVLDWLFKKFTSTEL